MLIVFVAHRLFNTYAYPIKFTLDSAAEQTEILPNDISEELDVDSKT